MISRRTLLSSTPGAAAAAGLALKAPHAVATGAPAEPHPLPSRYADLEQRTFRYFWELTNASNGLVPDRWPTPSFCSIAAVGFGLTAYPIGVDRGWITRAEARERTLATLRFFWNAPQGEARTGTTGHRGFFYHFIDMQTGARYRDVELSSVDTTLLFLGMLCAAEFFDGADPNEAEIRRLAAALYDRADWDWFRRGRNDISMGWQPEKGFLDRGWTGYNEGMMVALLALASDTHRVPTDFWRGWTETYPGFWRGKGATRHLAFAPLFGHQYSHVWYDFRGIRDDAMRAAGFDYFENSRRATFANRAHCIANPMQWDGYGKDIWGLTACDGPGNFTLPFKGREHVFYGYSARGPLGQPDERDDGTLSPTAALGCLPFAPEIVVPCFEALHREHGSRIYSEYGFLDAFNPSFRYAGLPLEKGIVYPRHGWVGTDYIGIDQGPILAMAANHRSGFVWRLMQRSAVIRRGLQRAGFTGGWLG